MQKVGDTGDISLLFFLAGANFCAISSIWGNLGHFWAILGHFWAIFCAIFFVAKYASVLFKSLFATLHLGVENKRFGGIRGSHQYEHEALGPERGPAEEEGRHNNNCK